MTCPGSFPSCCGENHPDPKSDWDLDPNKPRCSTSCRGDETDPTFLHVFSGFASLIPDFCN